MRKIRKNDLVIVISGDDKGKTGKVLEVFPKKQHVIVEGVTRKKHKKPNPNQQQPGGIVDVAKRLHVSNLMLVEPTSGKGAKVGVKFLEDGKKVRYFKRTDEVVDV